MTIEEKKALYLQLAHAMQTGVAAMAERGPKDMTPKHLRVGVNMAMVEHAALVSLLLEKGIMTEDEYYDRLIKTMTAEVEMYEKELKQEFGVTIHLH